MRDFRLGEEVCHVGFNITKLALANSLKGLMVKKAFSNISVRDFVDDCGLTRQAFYYHFKDKYDLVNWILIRQLPVL